MRSSTGSGARAVIGQYRALDAIEAFLRGGRVALDLDGAGGVYVLPSDASRSCLACSAQNFRSSSCIAFHSLPVILLE